ncbi:cytochrome C assembly family protein [Thermodesulfobacterium thermophilum]|uniref:cytochrome C assembly family protein n=1 Tax=Thermodesulfobacterium thermophilum TaxID=886 RepID=UPI0003B427BE|nr:cytochrome c biogenesis protein CcsA [Thermodesulfobacterium thermophilum]
MGDLLFDLYFLVYFISWIGFYFYFKTLKKEALKYAQIVLGLGFFLHTVFWGIKAYEIAVLKILTFKEVLNFLAWGLVLVYFGFSFLSQVKLYTVGFFILPWVIGCLLLSLFFSSGKVSPFSPYFYNLWFPIHGFSGLISHAFLLFGLTTSIMYILQEREIKKKSLGLFYKKLPPLEYLDRASEISLYLGFLFLSISIITGAVWSNFVFGDYWRWSSKEVFSLVLWLLYAVLIHQRVVIGWRGKRSAKMFILGFGIWFLSFFVINLFTKGFHTYGS